MQAILFLEKDNRLYATKIVKDVVNPIRVTENEITMNNITYVAPDGYVLDGNKTL